MRKIIAVIAVIAVFCGTAHAEDFASRVADGSATLATAEGKAYATALRSFYYQAIESCVPIGSNLPQNQGQFDMVAYIDAVGHPRAVRVKPSSSVSRCFAKSFASSQLPVPPPSPAGSLYYPMAVNMTVAP